MKMKNMNSKLCNGLRNKYNSSRIFMGTGTIKKFLFIYHITNQLRLATKMAKSYMGLTNRIFP